MAVGHSPTYESHFRTTAAAHWPRFVYDTFTA